MTSHGVGNISPTRTARRSTVCQPTGNISRHRVRPEVKHLVEEDTRKKKEHIIEQNHIKRAKTAKQHSSLLRKYELNKAHQMDLWRVKTKDSPLRLDQNMIHKTLMEEFKEHGKLQMKRKKQNEALKSMTGKPVFDICSDEHIAKMQDPDTKLALIRRKQIVELNIVKREQKKLDHMIEDTLEEVEHRFPQIALQRAFGGSSLGDVAESMMNMGSIHKQKVDADEARRINSEDVRIYSAAGRYDEFGRFILTDDLKTKAGMISAEYAQMSDTNSLSRSKSKSIQKNRSSSDISYNTETQGDATSISLSGCGSISNN